MRAYKLVRKLKDGTIASLFINKKNRLEFNKRMKAESHLTRGFAYRSGWHCLLKPEAPHLSSKGGVWVEVEVKDYQLFNRSESPGGKWVLAKNMKIIQEL